LADVFVTRIDEITNLLETTNSYPADRNIAYANLFSTEFMDISKSSNIEKRNVAKYLLKNESILGGVYFTLPDGDVYLGEPYLAQEQLPRINFADRDWFKGVSKTNETYILVRCSSRPLLELLQGLLCPYIKMIVVSN
jgi:hypothetical protein